MSAKYNVWYGNEGARILGSNLKFSYDTLNDAVEAINSAAIREGKRFEFEISFKKKIVYRGITGMTKNPIRSNPGGWKWSTTAGGTGAASLEDKAIEIGKNWSEVKRRLMSARSLLSSGIKKHFSEFKFVEKDKAMISGDGKYILVWKIREYPSRPISYENQQTSNGSVFAYETKSKNPRRRKRNMMPIVASNPQLLVLGNPRRRRRKSRRNGPMKLTIIHKAKNRRRSTRRRSRRNGGPWKGVFHKRSRVGTYRRRSGGVSAHRRRTHNRRHKRRNGKSGWMAFRRKHKGLYKRLGFARASKQIGMMWRKKH